MATEPAKKGKNNSKAMTIGLVILVILLGGAVFMQWKKKKELEEELAKAKSNSGSMAGDYTTKENPDSAPIRNDKTSGGGDAGGLGDPK